MKNLIRRTLKGLGYLFALALLIALVLVVDQMRFHTKPYDPTDRGTRVSAISDPVHEQTIEAARALIDDFLREHRVPGFSIAVGKGGEIIWTEADGYADFENKVPMTPDVRFDIGSTSKAITATLVMRLMEAGRVDIDRDVRDYVPEWPKKAHPVTVRHLLSHNAGIRHYGYHYKPVNWRHPSFISEGFWSDEFETSGEALRIFREAPLLFEPGSDFEYSTYGYTLISAALEGATGEHFLDLLAKEITVPNAMTSTTGDFGPMLSKDSATVRAVGYRPSLLPIVGDSRFLRPPEAHHSYKWAGGGIASTPSDMIRFANVLLSGRILKTSTFDAMTTVPLIEGGRKNPQNYALGWRTGSFTLNKVTGRDSDDREVRFISHGGSPFAGQAMMFILPEEGVSVALAMNATIDRGSRATRPLAARIAGIFVAN